MIPFGRLFILLMLGFLGLVSGCFIIFMHPYEVLFRLKIVFGEGGEIFEMWKKPEVDLYARIFLFNVTNSEEFLSGIDSKIKVQEVGPYVYREALEHTNVTFNSNMTLSTIPKHPLSWVPELSEGNREDDLLIVPNIALLSIANVVAKKNFVTRIGLNTLIATTGSRPLIKMTAKEFMMGYKSPLMTLGNSFMPGWIYFDKLGLIDRMYDFNGDYETIFTGEDDVSISGLIDTYKGSTDLPQWKGKHCSNVQYASDGTKFKSGLGRNDSVLFYRKSLCRAAPLVPVEEGVKSGLKVYKYVFPENLLDNGKYFEENKCFCRFGKCLPPGMIDVTDCYYGFPIALSYPHFYKGDKVLFEKVEGLQPNKEKHETRFWIQPDSGLPVDVSSSFQINMALDDISSITNSGRFSNMYLPLLWFDIRMFSLPPSMEDRFKLYLNVLPVVEQAAMYILFLVGTLLILLTVYRLAFKVMFKSVDKTHKHCNMMIGTDLWIEKEKNSRSNKDVYAPCEIPLNDESTDSESDPRFNLERIPSGFLKTHSDRIKELGIKLGDKVYDSVGSVKSRVNKEITNVKLIFNDVEGKDSLLPPGDSSLINNGYKSDSGEESDGKTYINEYQMINTSDSDDDCKYLEVVDDGSQFDTPRTGSESDKIIRINVLDLKTKK